MKGFIVLPLLFAFSEIDSILDELICELIAVVDAATANLVRQHRTSTAAASRHVHCPCRVHLAPHLDSTACINT